MTYPCPYCSQPASADGGCPSCGRGPDLDAIEVVRVDAEIADLSARLATARQAVQELEGRLGQAWSRRHAAAARVRASVLAARPGFSMPSEGPGIGGSREASTKLVQNALFLLGGLLLGIAAIVFTAVAWAQFGVGGRAALLAFCTAAALTVPVFALRRGLTATAETFAAVGLLLVLLDGYAAWYVNLFGVAGGSAWSYAGAVGAVTAAVAVGYARLTGLTGPRFAALIVAQPVLPLLVAAADPGAAGWAFTFVAVAALDLAVVRLRRDAVAWPAAGLGGAAVLIAAACALAALSSAATPGAAAVGGAALVAAALVLVVAALGRPAAARAAAGGLLVVALGVAAGRVAVLLTPGSALLRVAVSALAVALLVAAARRLRPAAVSRGHRIGALLVVAAPALTALTLTADAAVRTLTTAQPFFHAALDRAVPSVRGQLPATIAVLATAVLLTLPRRWRPDAALGAAAVLALALPAGLHLGWWTGPVFDLAAAAAALAVALRYAAPALAAPAGALAASPVAASPSAASAVGSAVTGATSVGGQVVPGAVAFGGQVLTALLLGAHAVIAGLGRPAVAAAVFAAIALLGLGVAVLARAGARRDDLGAGGTIVGLLALPALAWTTAVALGAGGAVQARLVLAVSVALTAVPYLLGRYRTAGTVAALSALVPVPLWALLAGDSPAVYAAAGLLGVAIAARPAGDAARPAPVLAGLALAAAFLAAEAPALIAVLVEPYAGLDQLWTGRVEAPRVPVSAAVAAAVLVAAVAWFDRRFAAPVAAVAVPLALAAAGLPWPVVAAAELLLGLALLLAGALRAVPVALPVSGALLAAPGLAALLPTRASTLAGLGAVVVAGAVAGAAGRAVGARVAGWLGASTAAVLLALTAGRAAGLDLRTTAFLVLGVAAATAALAWLGLRARGTEARAVEAAAHAGALVALLLTAGSAGHAAAVCSLWGLVAGLRALRPAGRSAYLVAAATGQLAAWFLVLTAAGVTVVEAYTVPAAVVCLLAGLLARRRNGQLSSWIAVGPALAAGLLPSLGTIAAGDGQYLRRLLLGLAALAVVLAGAQARLRAPVLLGGGVLVLVALHELALFWDLIPRWIPLAAGGLLLVVLATTLERRRRDLDRFRAALHRMT